MLHRGIDQRHGPGSLVVGGPRQADCLCHDALTTSYRPARVTSRGTRLIAQGVAFPDWSGLVDCRCAAACTQSCAPAAFFLVPTSGGHDWRARVTGPGSKFAENLRARRHECAGPGAGCSSAALLDRLDGGRMGQDGGQDGQDRAEWAEWVEKEVRNGCSGRVAALAAIKLPRIAALHPSRDQLGQLDHRHICTISPLPSATLAASTPEGILYLPRSRLLLGPVGSHRSFVAGGLA